MSVAAWIRVAFESDQQQIVFTMTYWDLRMSLINWQFSYLERPIDKKFHHLYEQHRNDIKFQKYACLLPLKFNYIINIIKVACNLKATISINWFPHYCTLFYRFSQVNSGFTIHIMLSELFICVLGKILKIQV